MDWEADPDWEWHSAAEDTPEQLRALWQDAVDRSRARITEALAAGGLDQLARAPVAGRSAPSLRWILCHMIEEYARHNGHADLLREALDGETGNRRRNGGVASRHPSNHPLRYQSWRLWTPNDDQD